MVFGLVGIFSMFKKPSINVIKIWGYVLLCCLNLGYFPWQVEVGENDRIALAKAVGASVRPGFQTPLQVLENKKIELGKKKMEAATCKLLDEQIWNKINAKAAEKKRKAMSEKNAPKEEPDKSDHRDVMMEDQNETREEPDKSDHRDDMLEYQSETKEEPDKSDHRDDMLENQRNAKKQKNAKEEPDKKKNPKAKANAKRQARPKVKNGIVKKDAIKEKKVTKKKEGAMTTEDPSEMDEKTLKKKLHSASLL